ncbi:MAG TPA: Gfo/Idh/MocA family oxidoreductase, partial [Micromonosporaceae bacterium]|nr:Gfo/Idh/MocA family oxidoreductase [Micromonosporaceae bacterium]
MKGTTRIAMVGAGSVARRHVRVLTGFDGVRVVAVADPVTESATALANECDALPFDSAQQALDAVDVDAVYVCVPPFAHGDPERAALALRLPLFVEKPVAVDVATAERVAALVAEAGVVTGTGYHWRCLDTVTEAKRLLAQSPPLLANGYWLDKRPPVSWWPRRDLSGGQVVEQLTHVLDMARVLLGEPTEVVAAGVRDPDSDGDVDADVDDAVAALVRFTSGAVATFSATSLLTRLHRTALHTVSRGLTVELSEAGLVTDDGADRRQ